MTALGSPRPPRAPTTGPRWVLHPALFAAGFVLDLALANQVEPAGFARSLGVAVVAALALTLIAWALTADRWLGGLVATTMGAASVSLRPLDAMWETVRSTLGVDAAMGTLGGLLFLALALPAFFIVRAQRGAPLIRGPATVAMNRLAFVLVIFTIVYHIGPKLPGAVADLTRKQAAVQVNVPESGLPDIYIVLMDGYPRTDILASRLETDNSAFIEQLRARGFDVAEGSHSNYVWTQVTLASMFQMRYLEDVPALAPLIGTPGGHADALRAAMTDGAVFPALRAAGYQIVVGLPGYEQVALRGVADRVLDRGELNDLERDLMVGTWLLDVVQRFVPRVFAGPQRARIVHELADLQSLPAEPHTQPMFVWMHIPAPHLPIVLDARGRTVPLDARRFDPPTVEGFGLTDGELHAAYAAEVSFLDDRLISAVDAIQASAADGRPAPVIVLFSDHGYYYDPADLPARFGNFLAASTPGAPGLMAGSPTPVNLFTLLLNRYLGTDFPLSEDQYFVSPSTHRELVLTELADPDTEAATR